MKRFLLIFFLTFSFEILVKADDIRDFEIEGLSLGDSALEIQNKDAIEGFEKRLIQLGVMTKKKIENVHASVGKDIDEAIIFANESPYPLPEDLLDNVYNEET